MSDKVTLALGMIVKDEVNELENILAKYRRYFDEVQITITSEKKKKELERVCKRHGAKASYFKWENDFSAARNFNKGQCKSDYIFRLDADDSIKNPEVIRNVVEKASEHGVSIVYCYYVYSTDANGSCNASHHRETIYKNDENLFWNKRIHENILPKSHYDYRPVMDNELMIIHHISEGHAEASQERNLRYLIEEYNKDKEKTDPRTLGYLGRMFTGMGNFKEAKFFLEKHIASSGWDEDRFTSWCYMAEIYKQEKNYKEAIACCNEALAERPDYPDAYLKLHDVYFDQSNWVKALEWGKMGLAKERPQTFMLQDPSSYTWRPWISMAYCYFMLSEFDKALKLFKMAQKEAPEFQFIKENEKLFEDAVYHKKYTEHFVWLLNFIKDRDKEKIKPFFDAIPKELLENETLAQLRVATVEPIWWNAKSIVIYCGNTAECWADPSIITGIGGSEEAVIHMSRKWAKMGYEVTVFNNCGDMAGSYNGVVYRSMFEFNPRDFYNILISWRKNIFAGITAKKKIVWFHDVPVEDSFNTKPEIDSFDKLVVLSKYHRTLFPKVPDSKILISSNGIEPKDFEFDGGTRRKNSMIYASSYDRGLEVLLNKWSEIKKQVPDAELNVCYGFNTIDGMIKMGYTGLIATKQKFEKLLAQEGVIHHGRLGAKDLLKLYKKCEFYVYPCTFEEINCIALTKGLASGCKAVTSDFAAVGERNNVGVQVPIEDYQMALNKALSGDIAVDVAPKDYIEQNSWQNIAETWDKELFKIKR